MSLLRRRRLRLATHWCALILAIAAGATAVITIALAPAALALSLYARETGQPCATCHTAFFELTPFGRRFKLDGCTLGGGDWKGTHPFAAFCNRPLPIPRLRRRAVRAPGFAANNVLAMQQMSLFTGGRITENSGAFIQGTYDGIAHPSPGTIAISATRGRSRSAATLFCGG